MDRQEQNRKSAGREDVRNTRQGEDNNSRGQDAYPGYPHYPANEDITQPENNNGKVEADENTIWLPEVSDIPGQENITPPPLGALADTTISSADEEDILNGDSLDEPVDDEDDVKIVMGTEADVTEEDLQLLGAVDADMDMNDDELTARDVLDKTDEDGELLNEVSSANDLDIPGSEDDDANESIGEEDEENNYYSLGSDDNDETTEGTP